MQGKEPAFTRVEELIADRPVMSWINLGEVFYVMHRLDGESEAQHVVRNLRPKLDLDIPSPERVLEAGAIKAKHSFAYADAFAIATAVAHGAVLLTGDPEILGADPSWPLEDLRA